ncbi:MAG: HD-GYP domain-containing protein [Deltaproteobacteria bacterium]|nr:MAG: HD-GYP domain-containing protein [Deltaproteobacteria bacterium]
MLSEHEKLDTLAHLGIELNRVQDLDILMEKILSEARRFVNADAGSIYLKENDNLHFSYTQNATLEKRIRKGEKLIYATFSIPIDQTSIAGYVATTGNALNIDDVYKIDPSAPYRFSQKFDIASKYTTRSALTFPLKTGRGEILGVLQIINARDDKNQFIPFSEKDLGVMTHFASIASVAIKRARLTRAIILRMIRMAEMRDPKETGAHVNRVASYSVEIYERWASHHDLSPEVINNNKDILRMAAMLHDVGKIAISDVILKKPGRFNQEEYEIMKKHTLFGAQLFQDNQSEFDEASLQVALNHHEWWNGEGYPGYVDVNTGEPLPGYEDENRKPKGKKGEEIPIFGRIVALTDVYDALCSARVYKEAWDEDKALAVIKENSGKQFDPKLVEILFESLDVIHSIARRYSEH